MEGHSCHSLWWVLAWAPATVLLPQSPQPALPQPPLSAPVVPGSLAFLQPAQSNFVRLWFQQCLGPGRWQPPSPENITVPGPQLPVARPSEAGCSSTATLVASSRGGLCKFHNMAIATNLSESKAKHLLHFMYSSLSIRKCISWRQGCVLQFLIHLESAQFLAWLNELFLYILAFQKIQKHS